MFNMDLVIFPLALALFAFLAFKRVSAPLLGILVTLFLAVGVGMPLYDTMTGPYMQEAASYFESFFLIFLTGAIFGAVMQDTGAAKTIANFIIEKTRGKFAAPMIMVITGVLTYGGISGFVVFFGMLPIALQLFKNANIPRKLIPAAISAGTWTWSMNSPGTPAIQNVIPIEFLGTAPTAALIPGLASGLAQFLLIFFFLEWRSHKLIQKGLTFENEPGSMELVKENEVEQESDDKNSAPKPVIAFLPPIIIILLFNIANMPVELAVALGSISGIVLMYRHVNSPREWIDTLNKGTINSAVAILNTAAVVGFAGVARITDGFEIVIEQLKDWNISPLWFVAITSTIAAGIAGSASGGLSAAYAALYDTYEALPVSMEYIHRISAISAGVMDTLPHQGALITLLYLTRLTHREAYFEVAITQIVIPFIALALVAIPLASMGL